MPNASLPLSGVRNLDLATFIAAPYCATILSEFRAEVIKVEEPVLPAQKRLRLDRVPKKVVISKALAPAA